MSRFYRGVWIERQTRGGGFGGSRLPYTARLDDGRRLSAETLQGMRALIRDALASPASY